MSTIPELESHIDFLTKKLRRFKAYAHFPPHESFRDSDNFEWKFCLSCEIPYVVCHRCKNNTCNAGTGINCDCTEAYAQFEKFRNKYTWLDFVKKENQEWARKVYNHDF